MDTPNDSGKRTSDIRREYDLAGLDEGQVSGNPVDQFDRWFNEALEVDDLDPNAFTLCTADQDGQPSGRIVLLKEYDHKGFVFYTNYHSRKARELHHHPYASMVFFWPQLQRQVRIEGSVHRTERQDDEAYFSSRPFESRIGAWVSEQSSVVESRQELEQRYEQLKQQYADGHVPLPDFWGGYVLSPVMVEFWQGRPGRLHDRIRYGYSSEKGWNIERLAP